MAICKFGGDPPRVVLVFDLGDKPMSDAFLDQIDGRVENAVERAYDELRQDEEEGVAWAT